MNNFTINDLYGYPDYDYLSLVIEYTLKKEGVQNAFVSIILVDNEYIHKLNKDARGIDKETDVLSFALEDNEEVIDEDMRMLGDIYISVERMKEQAKEYGHSEKRELSFLTVHGLLHLLGYDHTKSSEEEKIMFALQDEILNELNILR